MSILREGDRVGVPWLHSACGTCESCLAGWETLCPRQQNTGYSVVGGFAEYVLAPAAFAGTLPDGIGFGEAAPILCAGVATYKGLKETKAKPDQYRRSRGRTPARDRRGPRRARDACVAPGPSPRMGK